ncbi:MAG: hypothetical protein BWY31_00910 [Lentisphaerae bacterium ADurb.Bin242]|nr:MAG: hypothetical protein BWY31_00910 [Lentisphaerae bacterium ADurb.Bin242]
MRNSLKIVLPFPGMEHSWRTRAEEERKIDFRRDPSGAALCTAAYAASELKYFLEKAAPEPEVEITERNPAEPSPFVRLEIEGKDTGGGFELQPRGSGLVVKGHGRNGLLNGVYELLRLQGWRWLEPGPYGEIAPDKPTFDFLKCAKTCIPSFRYRMIDQYRESDDSVELLKWFSRHRINAVFRKTATGRFADKLGMLSRRGGHLLTKLMNPERLLPDGRTIWDAHPEWYGLPADGVRKKETALRIQLCFSQPGVIDYLCRSVFELLTSGEMAEVDMIDLWGFDTWGKNCSCEGCRHLGNGADQNLFLLSRIRDFLNRNLDRKVMMNTISYEGTVTMEATTKPVPRNLAAAGDFVIFYPIRRCYRHLLGDRRCELNKSYRESLEGWHQKAPGLSLWSGEYYNVSKFEDLPLVFADLIPAEMRYYHANGCNGATYMHNLSPNWGVRALTQLQHTQYAWDTGTDDKAFLAEYFVGKYGLHADKMRAVYRKIEDGLGDISSWRNWGIGALDVLMPWAGERPEKEFSLPHFPTVKAVLSALRKGVKQLESALEELRECLRAEQARNWHDLPAIRDIPPILTPAGLEKIRFYDKVEYRLGEDIRGLVYGLDTLRLLQRIVEYHDALYRGMKGEKQWEKIEELASKMSGCYVPIAYEGSAPGVQVKDALTRTQLRMLITRCRGARIRQKEKPA